MSTPHKHHNPGFLALVNDAKRQIKEIDIAEYRKMPRDGHVLIDTREDREWTEGHAAGAIHLSKGVINTTTKQRQHRIEPSSKARWKATLTPRPEVRHCAAR